MSRKGRDFSPDNGQAIVQDISPFPIERPRRRPPASPTSPHLIWPESAFPFLLGRDGAALAAISEFLRGGTTLVTGAARLDENGPQRRSSAFLQFDPDARPARPARRSATTSAIWCRSANTCRSAAGSSAAASPSSSTCRAASTPGPATPAPCSGPADRRAALICYEAIFPNEAAKNSTIPIRPRRMLNVTDDAWFGITAGPYQHFARRGCAPSRQACRWRAPPTPAFPPWSTPMAAPRRGALGAEAVLDSALPATAGADLAAVRWGSFDRSAGLPSSSLRSSPSRAADVKIASALANCPNGLRRNTAASS